MASMGLTKATTSSSSRFIHTVLRCALSVAVSALMPGTLAQGQTQSQSGRPTAAPSSVQLAHNGEDSGTYTIRTSANEVNLLFTVSDRHGRFMKDMKQSDFALRDDQKAPAKVYSFSQETNLPLRIGILIDTSSSIRQRFNFERQAATEFLVQLLRPKMDKAFIMGFDATPHLKQDWTNNLDQLTAGIKAEKAGGGTALYDALYVACRDKLLDSRLGAVPQRKVIILLSDGDDNESRAVLGDSIDMCQRAETIVYTISTNTGSWFGRGDDVLKMISEATGGTAFYPQKLGEISKGFRQIADELRSQYALQYKPADFRADGSFRGIQLSCLDNRYKVRAKRGYFTPRD
jgi:Ca-activated chloride channel homolog